MKLTSTHVIKHIYFMLFELSKWLGTQNICLASEHNWNNIYYYVQLISSRFIFSKVWNYS